MVSGSYDAVLTLFNRPHMLARQIESLVDQTVKPNRIFLLVNGVSPPDHASITQVSRDVEIVVINSSGNLGVWGRFWVGSWSYADFLLVLDDDTLPGERWAEKCLYEQKQQLCVIGARGLIFRSDNSYFPFDEFGWAVPNHDKQKVDLLGHSWFFPKHLAADMIRLGDDRGGKFLTSGEDICLCLLAEKQSIPCFVLPHREGSYSEWGSDPTVGKSEGESASAISASADSARKFDEALRYFRVVLSVDLAAYTGRRSLSIMEKIVYNSGLLRKFFRAFKKLRNSK